MASLNWRIARTIAPSLPVVNGLGNPALLAPPGYPADNLPVAQTAWQRRIERAQELAELRPASAEMLRFYVEIARFQQELYERLEVLRVGAGSPGDRGWPNPPAEINEMIAGFADFLSVVERVGPQRLREFARGLHGQTADAAELLQTCWATGEHPPEPGNVLTLAFLQPYAEFARAHSGIRWDGYTHSLCPFCRRKPVAGVLREQGDGGRRSLLCSFCLAEWEFRRIRCPGCGEEDSKKLPVYTADDPDGVRVECCDTCKKYIKTVDLTLSGRAEPLVDELSSAALDLWAQSQGYTKLQFNLLGI